MTFRSELTHKLRARVLYYWAVSKGKTKLSLTQTQVMLLLELDTWHQHAVMQAVAKLPAHWTASVGEHGLTLSGVSHVLPADAAPDVTTVFQYWVKTTGRSSSRTKLTAQRRRHIRARLRDFSAKQLCAAIDGLMASSWHTGGNPGGTSYTDIKHVFGCTEKTERFLETGAAADPDQSRLDGIAKQMERRRNGKRNSRGILQKKRH
jgi:hypothetical protein